MEIDMRYIKALVLLVVAAVMAREYGVASAAEKKPEFDPGRFEYENSCAACHGVDGKGRGTLADSLKKAPSDLTTLAKRNNGVLPVDRLYAWIDGRETVSGHGDRAMPIWGRRYSSDSVEAAEYYFDRPRGASVELDMYVRTRILALIDYLNRIQAK
jgi:mono/diheme cytochrome c family protein